MPLNPPARDMPRFALRVHDIVLGSSFYAVAFVLSQRKSHQIRSSTRCRPKMDPHDAQEYVTNLASTAAEQFQKLPGSAIFLRYVQSSYQNDPVRSAVELFLVLFAIRYLLAPKYSTKQNYVTLSEEVGLDTFQRSGSGKG